MGIDYINCNAMLGDWFAVVYTPSLGRGIEGVVGFRLQTYTFPSPSGEDRTLDEFTSR